MKKLISFIVIGLVNLLTLTSIYGQTLKLPAPQLSDFNVKNYFPKLGPKQIMPNSTAEKTEATRTSATTQLHLQLQKATLLSHNNYFDIYQLPIDKMPCIVPDNSVCYKMNSPKMDYNAVVEPMPNAMQQQNWVPGNLKKRPVR